MAVSSRPSLRTALAAVVVLGLLSPATGGLLDAGRSKLFVQAMDGDLDAVRSYVGKPKRLQETDHTGHTLLHWLVRNGHPEAVRLYLDAGADLEFSVKRRAVLGIPGKRLMDEAGIEGATPLYLAAYSGIPSIVALLLERGAEVDAATASNATPLVAAARWGDTGAVRLLLEHGAAVDHTDRNGCTPLLAAARGPAELDALRRLDARWGLSWQRPAPPADSHAGAMRLLLEHGADLQDSTPGGETALHLTAHRPDLEAVELLLAGGVGRDTLTGEGRNAALIAASHDHVRVAEHLVAAGARPVVVLKLIRDVHGTAVLHELVARRQEELGDRRTAYENYLVAAKYFKAASTEFETAARRQKNKIKRKEWLEGFLEVLLSASQAYVARTNAQEMAKIAALRDAVDTGTGLQGYYVAIDRHYRTARTLAALDLAQEQSTGPGPDLDSYSLNQSLVPEKWVEVFGVRALLARQASVRIYRHLEEHYGDVAALPLGDPAVELLWRTRLAWLGGALKAVSGEFETLASVSREEFVSQALDEVRPLLEQAVAMRPLAEDEYLVGYHRGDFLATNRALYMLQNPRRAIPIQDIVRYRHTLAGKLHMTLASSEELLYPDLERSLKTDVVEVLNPAVNR